MSEILLPNHGVHVWNAIDVISRALEESGDQIMADTGVNGKSVFARRLHNPLKDEKCDMRAISSLRASRKRLLYIKSFSKACPKSVFHLLEYVYQPDISLQKPIVQLTGRILMHATTTLRTSANGLPGCCYERYLSHPFYMRRKKWQAQAGETLQAANIASMILPLLLTFLPSAFFDDASMDTISGICYALLTDVINLLPLAFKGTELITLNRNPPVSTSSFGFGLDEPSIIGASYVIVLRCEIDENWSLLEQRSLRWLCRQWYLVCTLSFEFVEIYEIIN